MIGRPVTYAEHNMQPLLRKVPLHIRLLRSRRITRASATTNSGRFASGIAFGIYAPGFDGEGGRADSCPHPSGLAKVI